LGCSGLLESDPFESQLFDAFESGSQTSEEWVANGKVPDAIAQAGQIGLTTNAAEDIASVMDIPLHACALLRDIVGNPFRPVTFDPSWLTSTVLSLGKGIYEEKAFDRMPILADALQDAGCENENILNHCRYESVHVRGCWLVDLILGKE
jgi:hypothetical protein